MKLGAFFFGGVEMDDAGAGLPNPMDRRYSNEACWDATLKNVDAAVDAGEAGGDLVDGAVQVVDAGLQGDREVDELLEKLKELARRQQQEAERILWCH